MQETQETGLIRGWDDPLEEGIAIQNDDEIMTANLARREEKGLGF